MTPDADRRPVSPAPAGPGVCLLGPGWLVAPDGRRIAFRDERRYRLLAHLAAVGEARRGALAALFWPDRDEAAARSNLRKLLQELRQLPVALDESDGGRLRLLAATDLEPWDRAAQGGDDDALLQCEPLFATALEAGDSPAYAEWLAGERERRLRDWRAAALRRIGRLAPAPALALAQRLLAADPLDEAALQPALRAWLALGRRFEAEAALAEFARRLALELGVEPSRATRALLAGSDPAPQARVPVPACPPEPPAAAVDALVGREHALAALDRLAADPALRLLTIVGPGGIGKSRLAKEWLRRRALASGWVPLDDLRERTEVDARFDAERERDPAAAWCVLDNAEHLPWLPAWVQRRLDETPALQILVTSRLPMRIAGEHRLSLAPLDPQAAWQLLHREAGKAERKLGPAGEPAVAALLAALGGLPLALQIAGGWLRLLPPAELAREVCRSLDLLEAPEEGEERPEHRSVQATFGLSWMLLAPAEQQLLAALSVFAGDFTQAAARAVCGARLPLLQALADKSLLDVRDDGDEARFALHPLLKQYAAGRLRAQADGAALRARHAAWFGRWLAERLEPLRGKGQRDALRAIERALGDVRQAWRHGLEAGDPGVAGAAALSLMLYHEARGRREDGIALFTEALGRFGDAPAEAALLAHALATLHYRSGRIAIAEQLARDGLAKAEASGQRAAEVGHRLNLGLVHWQRGEWAAAGLQLQAGRAVALAAGDLRGLAATADALAMVAHEAGDTPAAEAGYREAIGLHRELDNARGLAGALANLGLLLDEAARPAEARDAFAEALRLIDAHGITLLRSNCLLGLGATSLALGAPAEAGRLAAEALAAARDGGEPHLEIDALMLLSRIALAGHDAAGAEAQAREAVAAAARRGARPHRLAALACLAAALDARGAAEAGATLWAFVAHDPASVAHDRRAAETALAALGERARSAADARAAALAIQQAEATG